MRVLMKAEKIGANLFMLKGETLQEADACVASNGEESIGHMLEQDISIGGAKYIVTFIDDYSKRCWVHPIKKKSNVFPVFKEYKVRLELESGEKIKCLMIDNSEEYTDSKFFTFWYDNGVKGHRLWDPTAHKIVINRDIIFVEDQLQRRNEDDGTVKEKLETAPIYVKNNIEKEDSDSSEAALEHKEQKPVESEAPEVRRSTRERRPPAWHSKKKLKLYTRTKHENLYNYHMEEKPLVTNGSTRSNLDVKTVIFHGELEEEIYMLQQKSFAETCKENLVCKLNKSPYGLKQAPRCWYKRFNSFIMSLEYNKLSSDHCAYYKRFEDNDFIILLLYVDDMLIAGPNKDRVQELKAQLAREFKMKDLGPANKILGMQIHQDRNNKKICLYQKNYLKKILRHFNMHVLGAVSQYMTNPGRKHWIVVKRILRYIRGTSDIALCYGRSEFTVRGYVDSDFAGDLDKRKSTTGYMFTLVEVAVSWISKLQTIVALSTKEAEYMAAIQACKEAIWIQRLLEELRHKQEKLSVYCDSHSALHIKEYVTEHHEVVVADQEAIVAEFETQQIHIEAATAAQKDSEHYQLISAWGHLKLVDALELRANQYPSHASQN
ncbi:Integrase catalytic domain-containing protein [Citrus sinensis]|nr:Integrase catalytic domain-containing protein [Citrus sinensis]